MILLLWACAGGDSADACADAANLHWETFGEPFMLNYCQACHASTAADRHGAPASVVFDTEAEVLRQRDRVLARATARGGAGGTRREDAAAERCAPAEAKAPRPPRTDRLRRHPARGRLRIPVRQACDLPALASTPPCTEAPRSPA
jgi:hypothetical protein